jgi:hypothetical protein
LWRFVYGCIDDEKREADASLFAILLQGIATACGASRGNDNECVYLFLFAVKAGHTDEDGHDIEGLAEDRTHGEHDAIENQPGHRGRQGDLTDFGRLGGTE